MADAARLARPGRVPHRRRSHPGGGRLADHPHRDDGHGRQRDALGCGRALGHPAGPRRGARGRCRPAGGGLDPPRGSRAGRCHRPHGAGARAGPGPRHDVELRHLRRLPAGRSRAARHPRLRPIGGLADHARLVAGDWPPAEADADGTIVAAISAPLRASSGSRSVSASPSRAAGSTAGGAGPHRRRLRAPRSQRPVLVRRPRWPSKDRSRSRTSRRSGP